MNVASIGSAITLDIGLIVKYFDAKRSDPNSILEESDIGPPPGAEEEDSEADQRRQAWLIKVKDRGISFSEKAFGQPRSLRDQVADALQDIANKVANIKAVEFVLNQTRSFVDLKHELDTNPNLVDQVKSYLDFFDMILGGNQITIRKRGVLIEAQRVLKNLVEFIQVDYDGETYLGEEHQSYTERVNEQGRILFKVMAEGAVAQISRQSILTVGSKVQERLKRVFRLLEEEFLNRDLLSKDKSYIKYSEYKRDRAIIMHVAKSYSLFSGSGKTFRSEDVAVALTAIEKGFKKEIKNMIREALESESRFYPDLEGETAAHLCAMFAKTLNKRGIFHRSSRALLKKCKNRFSKLELLRIVKPSHIKINWDNPCFYQGYRRVYVTQQALYEKMIKLGFSDISHLNLTLSTL